MQSRFAFFLVFPGLLLPFPPVSAETFRLNPVADAFAAAGSAGNPLGSDLTANNYGGVGRARNPWPAWNAKKTGSTPSLPISACPCAEPASGHPYDLTYGMNMYLSRWDQAVPSRLSRLPDPQSLAFMSDSPGGYASTVPSSTQYSVQARHNGRANVVFVDGHVESFSGGYLGCGSGDKTRPDVRWKTLVPGDLWTPNP